MPRYYFHVHDGAKYRDEEGLELRDIAAAKTEAARYAGQLLHSSPEAFWTGNKWQMEVTDSAGLILFALMFAAFDSPAGR